MQSFNRLVIFPDTYRPQGSLYFLHFSGDFRLKLPVKNRRLLSTLNVICGVFNILIEYDRLNRRETQCFSYCLNVVIFINLFRPLKSGNTASFVCVIRYGC